MDNDKKCFIELDWGNGYGSRVYCDSISFNAEACGEYLREKTKRFNIFYARQKDKQNNIADFKFSVKGYISPEQEANDLLEKVALYDCTKEDDFFNTVFNHINSKKYYDSPVYVTYFIINK